MQYRIILTMKTDINLPKYVIGIIEMMNIATITRNTISRKFSFYIFILIIDLLI